MRKYLSILLLITCLLSLNLANGQVLVGDGRSSATSNLANAQAPYKHSIGATLGSMQAISYKTFPGNHFAISLDLGTKFIRTDWRGWPFSPYTFELNANFMYEGNFSAGLYGFIGGGTSIGLCWNNYIWDSWYFYRFLLGKFGLNSILGLEYKFNIPLTLQFDFRPGYGMLFDYSGTLSYFDWNLNIGVRYTF